MILIPELTEIIGQYMDIEFSSDNLEMSKYIQRVFKVWKTIPIHKYLHDIDIFKYIYHEFFSFDDLICAEYRILHVNLTDFNIVESLIEHGVAEDSIYYADGLLIITINETTDLSIINYIDKISNYGIDNIIHDFDLAGVMCEEYGDRCILTRALLESNLDVARYIISLGITPTILNDLKCREVINEQKSINLMNTVV